jgi:hypothetical protein
VTPTPYQSFQGETATPKSTHTPTSSVLAATATPPPTSTSGGGQDSTPDSSGLVVLMVAMAGLLGGTAYLGRQRGLR